MDNGDWNGIEIGKAYVVEAKFSETIQGRGLADQFYALLLKSFNKDEIYYYTPKRRTK